MKVFFLFFVSIFVSSGIALLSLIQQYSAGNAFQFENIVLLWIFSNLYLDCFISIFLFISTLSVNNKMSFAMSTIFLGILIFFFFKGDSNYLKFLTPFYFGANNIKFMTDFSFKAGYLKILESLFSMLLYISVYLSMSLVAIKRRDL